MISVYEATRVPRYDYTDDRSAIIMNLIGQRAFITSALSSMCAKLEGSLELRFRSDSAGRIRIFVAITTPDEINPELRVSGIRVAERLLPHGYAWARRDEPALNGDLAGESIRVARLVRTLEFVDLPPVTLSAIGNLISNAPAASAPAGAGDPSEKAQSENDTGRSPRELPPLLASGRVLNRIRLCVPILGPLSAWHTEARVLMEELLASRPAAVSIHLRPTFAHELDQSLPAAALWRLCLKGFLEEIAGSGIADPRTIIGSFARYSLPAPQLTHISIRCGARNDRDAMAIASVLAACLGGARSFSVLPPGHSVSVDALRNIWLDYPRRALSDYPNENWKKIALRAAREANVVDPEDPEAVDLLARAPHIFTIDEAQILAQLPFSGEDGLPGIDTEMAAPFYGAPPQESEGAEAAPGAEIPPGRIRIGRQTDPHGLRGDDATAWHHIPIGDLTKHALVVGSTGSGKTVVTSFLITELLRTKTPFLIVEPVKTEYYHKLKSTFGGAQAPELLRFRFEGDAQGEPDVDFLPFDPLYLQKGVTVSRHASYLKSCFESAFPLDETLSLIFENGIRAYYTEASRFGCRLNIFSRGGPQAHHVGAKIVPETGRDPQSGQSLVNHRIDPCLHPSLDGFMAFFLYRFLPRVVRVPPGDKGPTAELRERWTQIFERRFDALRSGMIGMAARKAAEFYAKDPKTYDPFRALLHGNVVLELDGIPDDDQKALIMAFISVFLFERRQADDFELRESGVIPKERLKHVLVIEEAHRLLTNVSIGGRGEVAGLSAKAKSVSAFVDMLAEIRAFGQGLVIVEQIPTKIVPEAVKNTNLKIMLRLTAADDRDFLGSAMNLTADQKRFVTSLRAGGDGVNMVVFEQQSDQPRLLKLPFDA